MKKQLLAQTEIISSQIQLEKLDVKYRKATLNMALSTLACEEVLKNIPNTSKDDISLVFATHFGEVESSLDFLSTYRQTQLARPILFQNSLHNSSLGFASLALGLKGPGLTLSADRFTAEAAHNAVDSLLFKTSYVVLCFIDYIPEGLLENYLENHSYLQSHANKAEAFLYCRKT